MHHSKKAGFGYGLKKYGRWLSWALVAALATPVNAADVPASHPATLDDFIAAPQFSQVTLSPDGHYIAALVPQKDDPYSNLLAIVDVHTGKVEHVLHSPAQAVLDDYFWTGDERIVASIAVQRGGLDQPVPTGELFATDVDGRHQINLFGYRASPTSRVRERDGFASLIDQAPVDDHHVLIAINDFTNSRQGNPPDAALLDTRTGVTHDLGTGPEPNANLLADHNGQVRVAWADNSMDGYKVWLRADNTQPWQLLNEPSKSGLGYVPIGFNRDNSKLYVQVAHGDRPDAIALLDLASKQLTTLYQGSFADPGQMLPSADGKDFYAVVTEDGVRGLFYLAPSSTEAQLSRDLSANFPGQLVRLTSFSADGKTALVEVSSDRNPGTYYLLDIPSKQARYLLAAKPGIDPAQMRSMQPITLQTRDKLTLHGFLTLPAGNLPFALVVLPHGGPHGVADRWGFDSETQLLANHGYAVLQVNYRGSGGYGDNFISRGFRQWGLSMQDDLTDATRWAIAQGFIDPKRVCIYGASYGGYAALEAAVREPTLYRCAIGYAGIYDLRVQLSLSDTEKTDYGDSYLKLALGTDPADLLRRSPVSAVDKLQAAVLLIHGGADQRAPFQNFKDMTQAMDAAGKPYQTLVEPDEGHGFFMPSHRREMYQKLLDFLHANIGGAAN